MWHAWGKRYMYVGFCWGNLKETYYLEGVGVDGRIILKGIIKM
jgi:hypothetical protein